MTNELEILKSVESHNRITQRELAKRTGLSLGAVNVLIKKLIHKGLLKIEHISTKTIRYILTPKGLMEKARLTYKYVVASYNYIAKVEDKLEQIVMDKQAGAGIILYGEKDELYEIISSKLRAMNETFQVVNDISDKKKYNEQEFIIITWNPDHIEKEQDEKCKVIHILA